MVVTDVIQTITYRTKNAMSAVVDATGTIVQSMASVRRLTEDVFRPVTRLTENARLDVSKNGLTNYVINSAALFVIPEYVEEMTVVVQSDVNIKTKEDATVKTHAVVIV